MSGAAIVALGYGTNNVCSASCAGILVGGSHGCPDVWLLDADIIIHVLDIVRFLPNMSLAAPDEKSAQAAMQQYSLLCEEIPKELQLHLQPFLDTSKHTTPQIVALTNVMIEEFNRTTVPKHRTKESVLSIGQRPAVIAASKEYSNDPKVQQKIQDTARFDYGKPKGRSQSATQFSLSA